LTDDGRVVFLDRDGVITVPTIREGKGYAPRTWQDFTVYDDVAEALEQLNSHGFRLVIATNQPDLGANEIDPRVLAGMHDFLMDEFPIAYVHVCGHTRGAGCGCRKPLPGMLQAENAREAVSFERSWMVGDRDSDIDAGRAAGCRTIFVDRGWSGEGGEKADYVVAGLSAAATMILTSIPAK